MAMASIVSAHVGVSVLLFCLLVGHSAAQTDRQFQAAVRVYDDPSVDGIMTGTIFYNAGIERLRINWNVGASTVAEIIHFDTTLRYLRCGTTCDTQTFNVGMWEFHRNGETGSGTEQINGRTCTRYEKPTAASNQVKTVWIDGQGLPCRARFGLQAGQSTARTFDFTTVQALPPNAATLIGDIANCPQPTCSKQISFELVFDESGSVGPEDFAVMQNFAKAIADAYEFGTLKVAMGLTLFGTTARQPVPLTFSKNQFTGGVDGVIQSAGWTCIGCGITRAMQDIAAAPARPDATVVFIVMTDGENNRPTGYTNDQLANLLAGIVQNARNQGVIIFSIAVGDQVDFDQVESLSSDIAGVQTYFTTPDFAGLTNILESLILATCIDIPGNPCDCNGFCGCGGLCSCPSTCDDNSVCTIDTCSQASDYGCTYTQVSTEDGDMCTTGVCDPITGVSQSPTVCVDGNPCTIDTCNSVVGCQYPPNLCDDGDPCTLDTCNPANPVDVCERTAQPCDLCENQPPCPVIPCSKNECDPATGLCAATPTNCDDGNACSVDTCDVATGLCTYTPFDCSNGNYCQHHLCHPLTGCYYEDYNISSFCADGDLCTDDLCDPDYAGPKGGCRNPPKTCVDGDACTDDQCVLGKGCVFNPRDCINDASLAGFGPCYQALCTNDPADPARPEMGPRGCFLQENEKGFVREKGCRYCEAEVEGYKKACSPDLDTTDAIGIGAGVLAAIIIGVVIVCAALGAFGGKKGYDIWLNKRTNMAAANTNPLYDGEDLSGTNPMYDDGAAS